MWIKLCGLTDPESAQELAALRPDAVGLNFHPPSPRFVDDDVAREITAALPPDIDRVGVFVNRSADEIAVTAAWVGLTGVQLHGDEPPEIFAELRDRLPAVWLIRAWRMGADGLDDLAAYLGRLRAPHTGPGGMPSADKLSGMHVCGSREGTPGIGGHPHMPNSLKAAEGMPPGPLDAVLIDARVPGAYGGTGVTVDWERLAAIYDPGWPPLILAGGLTPANVADAIRVVRPWGVDTAGGVESAPGVKDAALAAAFVTAARGGPPGSRR